MTLKIRKETLLKLNANESAEVDGAYVPTAGKLCISAFPYVCTAVNCASVQDTCLCN